MERDQGVLEEIEDALKRIDKGTFGLCEGCLEQGKPPSKAAIPKARLNAVPYARYCVECARKRERLAY
jgi:DnaK suppressor protein